MHRGITGSLRQAERETTKASFASFGLVLQTLYLASPLAVIIIGIYKIKALMGYKTNGFALAYLIFSLGIDIGIEVEYRWTDSVGQQAFDDRQHTVWW